MHTNITSGTQIYTSDGQDLGKVKEVRGDYFKVNAPMQPDYWLDCDCVTDSTAGVLRLNFAKNHLDEHKRDIPQPVS